MSPFGESYLYVNFVMFDVLYVRIDRAEEHCLLMGRVDREVKGNLSSVQASPRGKSLPHSLFLP